MKLTCMRAENEDKTKVEMDDMFEKMVCDKGVRGDKDFT